MEKRSMPEARWLPKKLDDPQQCQHLERELGLHHLTARLLYLRGVEQVQRAEKFLSPSLHDIPKPSLLRGMEAACERLFLAIERRERIVIYGDYDVDGVTSTSILYLFLLELGVSQERLHYFIPNRVQHGYGLQSVCLPLVKELGCDLMVTVDCGIKSRDEVAEARQMGIETIIIDHHLTPPQMPEACAILNPHQPDCPYPDKVLAAVGVTFNLMMGLRAFLRERGYFGSQKQPHLRKYLDLVALGTVADLVPLQGVNRIFVRVGLETMKNTHWTGLHALMGAARVRRERLNAGTVGFQLGPRINAAGRLQDATIGVQLLTTTDPYQAGRLSEVLNRANQARREIERSIHQEARQLLLQSEQMLAEPAIVLAHEGWHPGVIGIVASRLVEEFHRPSVVISMNGEEGKGSARSIRGFHLHDGLQECGEFLIRFGGHKVAAGLTIQAEQIVPFRRAFVETARRILTPDQLHPSIHFDTEFSPSELSDSLLEELEELEPFGMENPAPLLVGRNVSVMKQRVVGAEGKHLQFHIAGPTSKRSLKAIAFGQCDYHPLPRKVHLAYRPQFDYWRGERSIQLQIKRIALS